jgi:isopenicillin-N epimerase
VKAVAGLRQLFLLRDDVVFLNHGSFGACPRPILDNYQKLQRELESEPVDFLHEERDLPSRMRAARAELARFLGARRDDLVFVPNATTGMNVVARSLPLHRDDEVVSTDHEYGAMDRMWTFVCEQRGAHYVRAHVPLPVESSEQIIEAVWSCVTERTRVLFLSHLTSTTALIFPIAELVRRARDAGITTVIDGAHAPGQIGVDLDGLGADFYVGNCHKWMMAPKGVGFLHASVRAQQLLKPLVVSWGWRSDHPGESRFVDEQEWTGTRDPSACLSVPAALEFCRERDWPRVQRACRELVQHARRGMGRLTGLAPICPDDSSWFVQMHTIPVPPCDRARLQKVLRFEHQIEIPVVEWNGQQFVRISCQGYNTGADVEAFIEAMAKVLRDASVFSGTSR